MSGATLHSTAGRRGREGPKVPPCRRDVANRWEAPTAKDGLSGWSRPAAVVLAGVMANSSDTEGGGDETRESETELRALTPGEAQELDRARRSARTDKVLVDAGRRDADATTRDAVADERERVADRESFVDPGSDYVGHRARRDAALDRRSARHDRESSAEDRVQLTEEADADLVVGDAENAPADEARHP
jgi:hypothetical protein